MLRHDASGTVVSPEREEPELAEADVEQGEYGEEQPRSIFSALWFRVVLVILIVGVVGAFTVPYVLEQASTTTTMPAAPARKATDKPETASVAAVPESTATAVPAPRPVVTPSATVPAVARAAPAATTPAPKIVETIPPAPAPKIAQATPPPAPSTLTRPASPPADAPKPPTALRPTDKPRPAKGGEPKRAATRPVVATSAKATGGYWVQVGAFRDPATAQRVAASLREQKYRVEESVKGGASAAAPRPAKAVAASGPVDRYDIHVSGGSASEVRAKLAAKGLAADPDTAGGYVVRPSLPLPEAVSLSKDLAADGLRVQVRRVVGGAKAPAPAPEPAATGGGGETLYRVRVAGFADRASAVAAMRELEAKGYKPFVGSGKE
ncbi:MAG: SPOR domain-containing protein [Candidatus Rokubacteria bacterium]|nr:SPOR domain-containing protein [Candidatus Rokubacteria bacterium]MBI3827718.1 SPOR domain-containing protein [Candidatus Rokubacteria bacterium]